MIQTTRHSRAVAGADKTYYIEMEVTAPTRNVYCLDCHSPVSETLSSSGASTAQEVREAVDKVVTLEYKGSDITSAIAGGLFTIHMRSSWGILASPPEWIAETYINSIKVIQLNENSTIPLAQRDELAYSYGFQGQERDDEVAGSGNSYTAEFWQYDSRLGRRWNVDPVVKYHESPYASFANNPIWFVDPSGADTSFVNNSDKQFVNNMLDKSSPDYSKKFAKKMNRLIKSDKMYKFESVEPGGEHKDGQVYADNDDKDLIHVKFTTGNSKMNSYSVYGFSKYKALFEETFHAWEYDKGRLDLMNPNVYNEARAWKFSSYAQGTQFTTMKTIHGTMEEVYTVMYQMHSFSLKRVANILKYGSYTRFDSFNQMWYAGSEAVKENGDFYEKKRGLYYDLPLK